MPTKFLYFDLGNVLLSFSHARMCEQMAAVAGVSAEAVRDALFGDNDAKSAQWRYEAGHLTTEEFFNYLCGRITTRPDRGQIEMAACDIFEPIEPMMKLVRRLAAAGNRLGILSNTNPLQWEYITDGRFPDLATIGQPGSLFEFAVLSYEAGSMKPDRHIYDVAIEQAGCLASEIFFTDDRQDNVAGARTVGIDVVHFLNAEQLTNDLRQRNVPGA
jgi:FMN phosphatase YigB (HAD superfamily)